MRTVTYICIRAGINERMCKLTLIFCRLRVCIAGLMGMCRHDEEVGELLTAANIPHDVFHVFFVLIVATFYFISSLANGACKVCRQNHSVRIVIHRGSEAECIADLAQRFQHFWQNGHIMIDTNTTDARTGGSFTNRIYGTEQRGKGRGKRHQPYASMGGIQEASCTGFCQTFTRT